MIFYVEDDNSIREIVLYTLSSMGFEAKGFEDGQSFLKALETERPSLVMLDVMLPDYDGVIVKAPQAQRPHQRSASYNGHCTWR